MTPAFLLREVVVPLAAILVAAVLIGGGGHLVDPDNAAYYSGAKLVASTGAWFVLGRLAGHLIDQYWWRR